MILAFLKSRTCQLPWIVLFQGWTCSKRKQGEPQTRTSLYSASAYNTQQCASTPSNGKPQAIHCLYHWVHDIIFSARASHTSLTFEFVQSAAMSSQSYPTSPSSPTFGFFPMGTTSPNAFPQFGYSPRDSHSMYAAFVGGPNSKAALPQQRAAQQPHSQGSLKRLVSRK